MQYKAHIPRSVFSIGPYADLFSKNIQLSRYRVVTQITEEHDFHQIKGTAFWEFSQAASAYTPHLPVGWRNKRMHR